MLLAIVCGFQHSLAMLADLIMPPTTFSKSIVFYVPGRATTTFGVGYLLVPGWYGYIFTGLHNMNSGLQGLFDSITTVLGTPCVSLLLLVVPLND